ncbi:uncharacterized protein L969DRAFT_15027 [Mixia osmundae IAM 14324]|uniref:Uncharacterized protein n=1 Tax=Mixia osmundae (strain CBS 9802 / IAM 14324 / JCM 22182 / KY 12970) TaxID=764103 RepID=G7DTI9_MIXOS|nr:uncharacterized protein L969DRAFT_15027 [Mixia osmundae IAM 14324]KEI42827.1 hypothetical protein L969DRAFT_15027 [Mixia osmundae IAM 14324]GAA93836.1 hypothetical protein E5Q_00482 [Mixia osmundae IAM 14324]
MSGKEEQSFTIQPHPATDNTAPHEKSGANAGLASQMQGKGPHILDKEVAEGLEKPKSAEELANLKAALNK